MTRWAWLGIVAMIVLRGAGAAAQPLPPPPREPPPERAPEHPREGEGRGQGSSGFAVEIGIGTQLLSVGDSDALAFGTVRGGFLLGYKTGPVVIGLGLELASITNASSSDGRSTSRAATSFAIVPGLRLALLQSADERAEMIAHADFGIGTTINSREDPDCAVTPGFCESDTSSITKFVYALGPGLRYWTHPQLALGLVSGIRGDYQITSRSDSDRTDVVHTIGIFAWVHLLGMF